MSSHAHSQASVTDETSNRYGSNPIFEMGPRHQGYVCNVAIIKCFVFASFLCYGPFSWIYKSAVRCRYYVQAEERPKSVEVEPRLYSAAYPPFRAGQGHHHENAIGLARTGSAEFLRGERNPREIGFSVVSILPVSQSLVYDRSEDTPERAW